MANAAPGKITVTGSTGPGQAVTTQVFTDVNDIEFDILRNVLKVTRAGAGGIIYYDLSALTTGTISFSGGIPTFVVS